MARLTLIVEDREVRTFPLTSAVTTIGRATDNDVVINNIALSRRHAEVHRRGERFEVLDKGSQNGVFVNEERVEGRCALSDGDRIQLGSYVFRFSFEEARSRTRRRVVHRPPSPLSGPSEEPTPPPGEIVPVTPPPALEPESRPVAVLTFNDLEIQRVPLEKDEYLIGRAKECDLQITERRLSRRHCLLLTDDDGRWMVKDMGSQNGTYVNRRRVKDVQFLEPGDVLNFAEYAVVFLAESEEEEEVPMEVAPPVSEPVHLEVRPGSSIEREKTEMPMAYRDAIASAVGEPVVVDDAELHEPVVSEPPRSRRARDRLRSLSDEVSESRAPTPKPPRRPRPDPVLEPESEPSAVVVRTEAPKTKRPAAPVEEVDVPDPDGGERPRPDPRLDAWYDQRAEDEEEDESSVLLERSRSTMSQVLSTMMVDKRELARNLEVARRRRRFTVRVVWGEEILFEGPLDQDVTVLGADEEADLRIRGRYVAGRHSLLVRVRDSLLLVRLGSSSAARVNGQPRLQAFLKDGDVIQIDETRILVGER